MAGASSRSTMLITIESKVLGRLWGLVLVMTLALIPGVDSMSTGWNASSSWTDGPRSRQPGTEGNEILHQISESAPSPTNAAAVSREQPEIDLVLRTLRWADGGDASREASNVAVDVLTTHDGVHEYNVLVEFDSGAMRLWQDTRRGHRCQPLVPLGLCPGEHVVSALVIGPDGVPLASSTPAKFTINGGDPDCEERNVGACSACERQPTLAGREKIGHRFCRVCSHALRAVLDSDEKSGSTTFRQFQGRLLLRTSLVVSTIGGNDGRGHQEDREWAIELREGDSPASSARDFVVDRLGLRVDAPSGALPGFAESKRFSALQQSDSGRIGARVEESEGDRVVQMVAKRLEAELAQRQDRRSLKRTEAAQIFSRTGQLRVVLCVTPEESRLSSDPNWLVTDVNTLDVTDPAEFAYFLGDADDGLADAFLVEHAWEHLSLTNVHQATRNCYQYLRPGGRLRLAMPDPAWYAAVPPPTGPELKDTKLVRGECAVASPKSRTSGSDASYVLVGDVESNTEKFSTAEEEDGVGFDERDGTLPPRRSSGEILVADKRDNHLVQFTPELLANVCWSAGFFPVLLGETETRVRVSERATKSTARKDAVGGNHHHGSHEPKEAADEDNPRRSTSRDEELWGGIKRSAVGADPRGAASIMMDCIKPRSDEQERLNLVNSIGDGKAQSRPSEAKGQIGDSVFDVESLELSSSSDLRTFEGIDAGLTTTVNNPTLGTGPRCVARQTGCRIDTFQDDVAVEKGEEAISSLSLKTVNIPRTSTHDAGGGTEFGAVITMNHENGEFIDPASGSGEHRLTSLAVDVPRKHSSSNWSTPRDLHDSHAACEAEENHNRGVDPLQYNPPRQMGEACDMDGGGGCDCELRTNWASMEMRVDDDLNEKCLAKQSSYRNRFLESGSSKQHIGNHTAGVLDDEMGFRARLLLNAEGAPGGGNPSFRITGGVSNTRATEFEYPSLYQHAQAPVSLKEWAAAARNSGRVYAPAMSESSPTSNTPTPVSRESDVTGQLPTSIYATSAHQVTAAVDAAQQKARDDQETVAQQLVRIRIRAREALFTGDVNTTFELCRTILENFPSDGITLLYQGVAMAQIGEQDAAWDNMERVVALSHGVQQNMAGERDVAGHRNGRRVQAAAETRVTVLPLETSLAAFSNLATFARARAAENMDSNADTFFLIEALCFATACETTAAESSRRKRASATNVTIIDSPDKEAVEIGGFVDVLAMMAQSFEEKGQLTVALRLYQRVILLGGHRDQRMLHGLARISRLLLQMEKERVRDRVLITSSKRQTQAPELDVNSRWTKSVDPERGCGWTIVRPGPGQVFSIEDAVPIEFNLMSLDPGLPSAGSLFETTGASSSDDNGGLGVVVCSYLEEFEGGNCMPNGIMRGVSPGWHVLTAEAYQLPSLSPFSCFGRGEDREKYSMRTVRFCVGDATICGKETVERSPVNTMPPNQSTQDHIQSQRYAVKGNREPAVTTLQSSPSAEVVLPFCFMTLALNAMPFITHHGPVFQEVGEILASRAATAAAAGVTLVDDHSNRSHNSSDTPPPEAFWEWHVVEGVAAGRADHGRPYSRQPIPDRYFDPVNGLSTDGTSQYLDYLVAQGDNHELSPERRQHIRVHRRCGEWSNQKKSMERGIRGGINADNQSMSKSSARESSRVPPPYEEDATHRKKTVDEGDRDTSKGRKTCLWRDKIQMVNTATLSLEHECLLVEIDADELWTAEQLVDLRDMFLEERDSGDGDHEGREDKSATNSGYPASRGSSSFTASKTRDVSNQSVDGNNLAQVPMNREKDGVELGTKDDVDHHTPAEHRLIHHQEEEETRGLQMGQRRECAYVDCHFFVGWDLVTVTENGWGHSANYEWLRAWVFHPFESVWLSHAPPELATYHGSEGWRVLRGNTCINKEETRRRGLIFTHFAYVFEEQVRFKSHFYGHSENPQAFSTDARERATNTSRYIPENSVDAVAEWRALQKAHPPVRLADYLTWLRVEGSRGDSRLLETIADRPGSDMRFGEAENGAESSNGGVGTRGEAKKTYHTKTTSRAGSSAPVPSEPFIRIFRGWREHSSTATAAKGDTPERIKDEGRVPERIQRDKIDVDQAQQPHLTHNVNMQLKGTRVGERRERTVIDGGGTKVGGCDLFHLVVDGVVFQVDAAKPKGIFRVWASVLPLMMERLGEFEGACLTLLIRGLAAPPKVIQDAFRGRSPERFSLAHVPTYTPTLGFVTDRLMLSWVVRSAGATAFVSTLYTQPSWATTPNVVRLLMIHDLIPEVLGLDMSKGEWLEKANAVAMASRVVAVSQDAAREFLRVYHPPNGQRNYSSSDSADHPSESSRPVWAAHNGVDTTVFRPIADTERENARGSDRNLREAFRSAAGLDPSTPYVLIIGSRLGYKNARASYRALGLAAGASSSTLALVIVGGGALKPEELELLNEVKLWSHVGAGSGAGTAVKSSGSSSDLLQTAARKGSAVDDELLAAGYSGAVALLHLSMVEGFGLTVLEAFACGCPVVAVDIPPVREIAGLPDVATSAAGEMSTTSGGNDSTSIAAPQGRPVPLRDEISIPDRSTSLPDSKRMSEPSTSKANTSFHRANDSYLRETMQNGSAASDLKGGLVLVKNPRSATQIWRALRAIIAMDTQRRALASEALVRRARVFESWQPLADALVKAAVN